MYGEKRLSLSLGLRRDFGWNFCVAAMSYSIIGADLLRHYGLLIDVSQRRLIDPMTGICVMGFIKGAPFHSISTIDRSSAYSKIQSEFPEVNGLAQAP